MYCRNLLNIYFVTIIFLLLINLSAGSKNVHCTAVGFCKCEFPNGQGVDLTLLRGLNFNVSIGKDEFLLFYPCKNLSIENSTVHGTVSLNECELGVSICLQQRNGNDSKFFNLGSLSESNFDWMNVALTPVLVFHHLNWTTNINLECSHSMQSSLEWMSKLNNNIYNLELKSENSCVTDVSQGGHSVLSLLLIILLVLFLFYFFCGFLVLRFIRGARGWEAIPDGEFWRSVGASFKKVFLYFMNGCQHPEVYDNI